MICSNIIHRDGCLLFINSSINLYISSLGETHEILAASGSVPGIVVSCDEFQDPLEPTSQ